MERAERGRDAAGADVRSIASLPPPPPTLADVALSSAPCDKVRPEDVGAFFFRLEVGGKLMSPRAPLFATALCRYADAIFFSADLSKLGCFASAVLLRDFFSSPQTFFFPLTGVCNQSAGRCDTEPSFFFYRAACQTCCNRKAGTKLEEWRRRSGAETLV
jgi:hypothetical protein